MKAVRVGLSAVLASLALGSAAFAVNDLPRSPITYPPPELWEWPPQPGAPKDFHDPSVEAGFPKAYPAPESPWKVRQKDVYRKLLARGTYDGMVVPVQVDGRAFDRTTRSLMTAELSAAVSDHAGLRTPDPYLLARALGEGERQYDPADVNRLAQQLGIKRILWTHVGHDRSHRMHLMSQVLETGELPTGGHVAAAGKMTYMGPKFPDEKPPIEVFRERLPKIVGLLPAKPIRQPAAQRTDAANREVALPEKAKAMFTQLSDDPVRDAYQFQLLAYLTPENEERTRERFIEKSLLALNRAAPASPGRRALLARAYMHMGLRPAALHLLDNPSTGEEKALVAALNGNLPLVRAVHRDMEPGIPRLLTELDANRIGARYMSLPKHDARLLVGRLDLPGQVWPFLFTRALTDWDLWSQSSNRQWKQLLDNEFPVADYSLDEIVTGAQALGDAADISATIDLSVGEHIARLMAAEPQIWCCESRFAKPGLSDYVDLLASIGTDNLMARGEFLITLQGSPERAQRFLDSLEAVYDGHPRLALLRAKTLAGLAARKSGAEKEGLLKNAYVEATNALFWAKGQTRVAADAFNLTAQLRRNDFGDADNPYAADYPFRSFYPPWEKSGNASRIRSNALAALNNSTDDFLPVTKLKSLQFGESAGMAELLASIDGRFDGNAEYVKFMAEGSLELGNTEEAARYFRARIQTNRGSWDAYEELGKILVEDGHIDEAFETLMSWPGFREGAEVNAVTRANASHIAGSFFYWTGNFDKTEPFYRLSAEPNTGSEGSIASVLRLQILDGDYEQAMQGMLNRARRYNSTYAYRDYLGMLHVTGHSDEAWSAFNIIVNRQGGYHPWETALAGHHIASLTEAEIGEWAQRYKELISSTGDSYAAFYLLRAGVTDRVPTAKLAELIEKLDHPVWELDRPPQRHVYREAADRRTKAIVGPQNRDRRSVLPINFPGTDSAKKVPSDLAYFAQAYRAIRMSDDAEAARLLGEAADLYNLGDNRFGYLLPYFAFASAQAGDTAHVEKVLSTFNPKQQRFDFHLANAVLAGLRDRVDDADKHLTLARYRRPHTEDRPLFSEYMYAEICELLYDATKRDAYRQRLVDWAGKARQFFPWYSWPYGMLAKYSKDANERQSAMAISHYLDKNSERLQSLPQAEIEAAVRELGQHNPFAPKPTKAAVGDGAI